MSGFGAATGQATARQDASGSWNITLTVHHLKNFGDAKWYECWYVSRRHGRWHSAGTFLVPDSGSGTFSMTSAVDPHDFSHDGDHDRAAKHRPALWRARHSQRPDAVERLHAARRETPSLI